MIWIVPLEKDTASAALNSCLVYRLLQQLQNLRRTRDLRLPRLLPGLVEFDMNTG